MALLSGAEDGAQTRDPQLGRLVLYQLSYFRIVFFPTFLWAQMDSNHRRRKPADLQSAPFGHSGICPSLLFESDPYRIQTYNLLIRSQVLYSVELTDLFRNDLWALTDSNRRPSACKADALNQLS